MTRDKKCITDPDTPRGPPSRKTLRAMRIMEDQIFASVCNRCQMLCKQYAFVKVVSCLEYRKHPA